MNTSQAPPAEDADRILLVDDDATNLDVLRHTLDGRGYRLFVTRSGESALEVARRVHPALVLLDVVMPGIDGYETCRRIRQNRWSKDMRCIAVTGWGQDEDRRRSAAAGFDEHLVKPVEPALLERVLGGVQSTAQA